MGTIPVISYNCACFTLIWVTQNGVRRNSTLYVDIGMLLIMTLGVVRMKMQMA